MLRFIAARDYNVMRRANRWDAPRWIRLWMIGSTRGGDGWLWCAMGLFILAFGGANRFLALGSSAIASALSVVLFQRLKKLTGRRRPCQIEPHRWATLLPPDQFSFPSGHTMTAFAVVVPMSIFYPALAAGLMFCAVSIAISRVLLGMHFLSDVIAAAVLGAGLGYAAALPFLAIAG